MSAQENDWDLLIHPKAEKELAELQIKDRKFVDRAIIELGKNPRTGDIQWLKPTHLNMYRKRIGRWRIFFMVEPEKRIVLITGIRLRTSTTY
jgi:mRNA-degrading endonuclease RelE of RelBE toxin-antitoxin system